MKDTARILVDWKCNLKCAYCCNEQERFRKDILPISLTDIPVESYKFVCISGGEPLLFLDRIKDITDRSTGFNILYSNGILWKKDTAAYLERVKINAVNIGLHYISSFEKIIKNVSELTEGSPLSIRFHVNEEYATRMTDQYPNTNFRFWKMDDCDRDNEDRYVLI